MADFDLPGILSSFNLQPTAEERRQAANMALMRMGLGILAANRPTALPVNPMGVLAEGGLAGVNAYQTELDRTKGERKQNLMFGLQGLQIRNELAKQAALKQLLAPTSQTPVEPPAGIDPRFAASIEAPWAARPQQPPQIQSGGYQPIPPDRLAAAAVAGVNIDPFIKLNERAQPKGENVPGVGMVDPYTGRVIAPLPRITDTGRAAGIVPDGQGGWRVQVPQGSVEAYSAFQRADEQARAGFDFITVPDGRGGSQLMSRAEYARRRGGENGPGATPGGNLGYQRPEIERQGDQRFAETLSGEMGKTYADLLRADFNAPATIAKYQRLGTLLSQVNTGKWKGTTTELKAAAKTVGIDLSALGVADDVAPAQAARALSNQMALELRNPAGGAGMPGALSDKDREFLVQSIPGLENDPNAWPLMVEYRVKLAQREQQVAKMARAYKKKNGRFDDGFYDELAQWSERNPLFTDADRAKIPGASRGGFRVIGVEGP